MKKFQIILIKILCFSVAGFSQQKEDLSLITLQQISADVRFLASDELMGRATGHYGSDIAARYIAEQFRAAGVVQLPDMHDYFQPVALKKFSAVSDGYLVLSGDTLFLWDEFLCHSDDNINLTTLAGFAGYGLKETDYENSDLKSNFAIVRYGADNDSLRKLGFRLTRQKEQLAKAKGVKGLIHLYDNESGWQRLQGFFTEETIRLESDISEENEFLHIYIKNFNNEKFENLSLKSLTLKMDGIKNTNIYSANVVGMVPGKDKKMQQAYILLGAHYDHIGFKSNAAAGEDSVFNGARDNAMGIAALLSAARFLAQNPAARPVVFVAFTGEEMGMLGSRHFTENPPLALQQIIFMINSNGAGYSDTSIITAIALKRTTVEKEIIDACLQAGLSVYEDAALDQMLFGRSDNFSFARKGIPAITFSPGFRNMDENLMAKYHKVDDEIDQDFNMNYLLKFCRAFAGAAFSVANSQNNIFRYLPLCGWNEGDEFIKQAQILYQNSGVK